MFKAMRDRMAVTRFHDELAQTEPGRLSREELAAFEALTPSQVDLLLRDELKDGAVADSPLARVTDGLARKASRVSEPTRALAAVIAALVGSTLVVASILLIAAAVVGSPTPMAEGPSDSPSSTSAPQQGSLGDTVQGLSADTGDW